MTLPRRRFLRLAVSGAVLPAISQIARAQDYPTRYIRVVVPWPPGGLVDIAARVITEKTKDSLGQAFIIENRPGAGGSIGAAAVAKAEPDGYTLMLTSDALVMNASIGRTPYDVVRDFAPILIVANVPLILVTHSSLKVGSVNDLVALARSLPGQISYGSAGLGSPGHFTTELFRQRVGLNIVHVPYKGAPEAVNDLIGGRISFVFINATVGIPQVQAGNIKALAITSEQRSSIAPDVPTMREAGFADFKVEQWLGFLAPAKTPKPVVDTIASAVKKSLANEEVKATLARNAIDIETGSTPETFEMVVKSDMQKWREVAKTANIKAN